MNCAALNGLFPACFWSSKGPQRRRDSGPGIFEAEGIGGRKHLSETDCMARLSSERATVQAPSIRYAAEAGWKYIGHDGQQWRTLEKAPAYYG